MVAELVGGWVLRLAVVSMLVVGGGACASSGDDGAERARSDDPEERASRVDPADPDEMASVAVDQQHVPIDVTAVGAVGEVLLAYDTTETAHVVVQSTDHGATWSPVTLPGAPAGTLDPILHVVDRMAVMGHVDDAGEPVTPFLWTTSDGVEWRGGPVPTPTIPVGGVREVDSVWRRDNGQLVALVRSLMDEVLAVLVSDDGVSWRVEACPPESLIDTVCTPVETAGDLWFTGGRGGGDVVSLDGGRRWQAPTMEPVPTESDATAGDTFRLRSAVELRSSGWLGTAHGERPGGDLGLLVRSDDGIHWGVLVGPDPCEEVERPGSVYWEPVPLGDRWLVAYMCEDGGEPQRSELYLLEADGTNPVVIEGSPLTEANYRFPVAVGGVVVAPTYQHEIPTGDALVLRP